MNNDDHDKDRIADFLHREASLGRRHTADCSWHDRSAAGKSLVERGWLDSLIEELGADGLCRYDAPITSDDDGPTAR